MKPDFSNQVTGQAFEDMQEQNSRLLQQLREKDDANFKLMSERIKGNQVQKLLREEKSVLREQVDTIHSQLSAQNVVVRKLEEKERILQTSLLQVEKESRLRQQAMELHKRKALESTQTAADLKLHLDKYMAQVVIITIVTIVTTFVYSIFDSHRFNLPLFFVWISLGLCLSSCLSNSMGLPIKYSIYSSIHLSCHPSSIYLSSIHLPIHVPIHHSI